MRARDYLPIVVVLAVGGTARAVKIENTQELKVAAHATISVDSEGGAVSVEPGPAGKVTVVAERKSGSSEDITKSVSVTLEGNTVKVRYRRPGHVHWHSESVDFRITAPPDSRVVGELGGGSVSIRGLSGGVDMQTGGGAVGLDDVKGGIKIHTGGGSISLERVGGPVEAVTGGGSVRLRGALSGRNVVETGGGSISVAIPADSRLDVEASTGGGSAHNDFGIPTEGGHWGPPQSFHGKIGDGGAGSLHMSTGGGSISLERS